MPQAEGSNDHQAIMFDQRLAEQNDAHPGYREAWSEFERVIMQHGGRLVVPPLEPDPLIGLLREEGVVTDGGSARLIEGQPSDCHTNAVRLWRTGQCDAIGTGYALSEDGLWREHSWGVTADLLVETTTHRLRYFGVMMTDERAAWFADWVDPPS